MKQKKIKVNSPFNAHHPMDGISDGCFSHMNFFFISLTQDCIFPFTMTVSAVLLGINVRYGGLLAGCSIVGVGVLLLPSPKSNHRITPWRMLRCYGQCWAGYGVWSLACRLLRGVREWMELAEPFCICEADHFPLPTLLDMVPTQLVLSTDDAFELICKQVLWADLLLAISWMWIYYSIKRLARPRNLKLSFLHPDERVTELYTQHGTKTFLYTW